MLIAAILSMMTLLILIQVNILPLNLSFAAVCALFLFSKRDFSFWWVLVTAVLLALFANLNPGLVLIGLTATFLPMDLLSRLLPENRLVKVGLLLAVLFVSEYSLISLERVLG